MAQRVRATKLSREHYGKAVMLTRTLSNEGKVRTDWYTGALLDAIPMPHQGAVWLLLMNSNGVTSRYRVKDTWSITVADKREMELRNVH